MGIAATLRSSTKKFVAAGATLTALFAFGLAPSVGATGWHNNNWDNNNHHNNWNQHSNWNQHHDNCWQWQQHGDWNNWNCHCRDHNDHNNWQSHDNWNPDFNNQEQTA